MFPFSFVLSFSIVSFASAALIVIASFTTLGDSVFHLSPLGGKHEGASMKQSTEWFGGRGKTEKKQCEHRLLRATS